jgi:hypothetical protein
MELFRNGFITLDQRSGWVLINKFLKFNRIENPNQGKSAAKLFDQIPDSMPLKRELFNQIKQFSSHIPNGLLNSFETVMETVSKPLPEPYRNQEQEQEQKLTSTCGRDHEQPSLPSIQQPPPASHPQKLSSIRFEEFWKTWPSSPRKVAKAKCVEVWRRRKLDEHAEQILAHVTAMKATEQWCSGYEPAPMTYLNQSRWQDGEPGGNGTATTDKGNGAENPRLAKLLAMGPQPDGSYIDREGTRWITVEEYLRSQVGDAYEPVMIDNALEKWAQMRTEAEQCSHET